MESDNDTQFTAFMRRVAGCFSNWDILPEKDIEDAMNSISLIMKSKIKYKFIMHPFFSTLIKMALDFTKDIPSKIRRVLVLYSIVTI